MTRWRCRANDQRASTLDEYSVNRYETATLKLSVRFDVYLVYCSKSAITTNSMASVNTIMRSSYRPHYASCPSVCLSVSLSVCPVRDRNSKTKNVEKQKLAWTFPGLAFRFRVSLSRELTCMSMSFTCNTYADKVTK